MTLVHFSIISKFGCCDCYMKKNVPFALISFAVLKWDDRLSVQVQFTRSKCEWTRIWTIYNVDETTVRGGNRNLFWERKNRSEIAKMEADWEMQIECCCTADWLIWNLAHRTISHISNLIKISCIPWFYCWSPKLM